MNALLEIDSLMRRTLVSTVLTAVLVLAYFGSVLLLQNAPRAREKGARRDPGV